MVKVGDIVIYSLQGRSHNAIVLALNSGQVNHLGANGEPLLHLLFIAPERESEVSKTKIGYIPSSFIEYDVVHHSQEFSEQYKKDNGLQSPAQIASARGQGEWREVISDYGTAFHNVLKNEIGKYAPTAPPLHDVPIAVHESEPEPTKADRKSRWGKPTTTNTKT